MRVAIEARLVDDSGSGESVLLGEFERPVDKLDPAILGLTLEEGQDLLHKAQQFIAASQVAGWLVIAPPAGSFSWIEAKYVKTVAGMDRIGIVDTGDPRTAAPILPGSSVVNKEPSGVIAKVSSRMRRAQSPVPCVRYSTGFAPALLVRTAQAIQTAGARSARNATGLAIRT